MTVSDAKDLADASRVLCRANASLLVKLSGLVDVALLEEGDAEDDYFVDVPSNRLHDLSVRIVDEKIDVCARFEVYISVFPIPR